MLKENYRGEKRIIEIISFVSAVESGLLRLRGEKTRSVRKIVHSIIDKNGEEYISFCINCHIDELAGYCDGEHLIFENNHKKQTCKIMKSTPSLGNWKTLQLLKDEILTENECIKWMKENGYTENCKLSVK